MDIGTLTLEMVIAGAADRYKQQNERSFGRNYLTNGRDPEDVYKAILADPTAAGIEAAVGNRSWTTLTCDCCDELVSKVWIFSNVDCSIYACKDCLTKAMEE